MKKFRHGILSGSVGLLGVAILVSGCKVANHALRSDFTDFNTALQFNQTQQMLLNLVRLHYRESPMFLQAGSLTASYESQVGGNIGVTNDTAVETAAGVDYSFSSKPTVSYVPVEGRNYVQQLLTEISSETFCLLLRSGWPVAALGELLIDRVTMPSGEVLINHAGAASESKFQAFIDKLAADQANHHLTVVSTPGAHALQSGGETIPLERFQLRSLFDVMFATSRNIPSPPGQEARARSGESNGKMTVRVSATKSRDAMVWVKHRGYFYSISNDDVASKDTLALLMQLYRIQSAPPGEAPQLTIPVR